MQLSEKSSRLRCDSRQGRNPGETGYLNANNQQKLLVAESRAKLSRSQLLSAEKRFYESIDFQPNSTVTTGFSKGRH
jgi:hypothetical protein